MRLRRDDPQERLSRPRRGRRLSLHYDPDAFGRFSESIARFLGTGRFLMAQTVLVAIWITLNVALVRYRWDPYPFILLNLAFSTQAAYAAPLILLAQNRQEDRDRAGLEADREVNARQLADTEFLARELASIRIALSDVVTNDDLEKAMHRVDEALARLDDKKPKKRLKGVAEVTAEAVDAGPGLPPGDGPTP